MITRSKGHMIKWLIASCVHPNKFSCHTKFGSKDIISASISFKNICIFWNCHLNSALWLSHDRKIKRSHNCMCNGKVTRSIHPNKFICDTIFGSEDLLVFQLVSDIFEFSGNVPLKTSKKKLVR